MQNYFQAIWMLTIKLPQLISSNADTIGMSIKIKTNLDRHIINQTLYTLKVKVKSLSRVQLFATPWTVAYHAPPSMGFFQARLLEWAAISFCRGSSQPRDQTQVSRMADTHFTI